MPVIDFTIYVRHKGSQQAAWAERYQKETDNPKKWGMDIIAFFNSTCEPGERKREFVSIMIHGEVPPIEHNWSKTSLMTQTHGNAVFDKMACELCGITGKRFRLNQSVKRDSKYRAKVYARCDTAVKYLEAKKEEVED